MVEIVCVGIMDTFLDLMCKSITILRKSGTHISLGRGLGWVDTLIEGEKIFSDWLFFNVTSTNGGLCRTIVTLVVRRKKNMANLYEITMPRYIVMKVVPTTDDGLNEECVHAL